MNAIARLLKPASIALVGASPDATKLAGRPLAYLQKYGYGGAIHLVNPKHAQMGGLPCVASVADLPYGIDLALILLPASAVEPALLAHAQPVAADVAGHVAVKLDLAAGYDVAGYRHARRDDRQASDVRLVSRCGFFGLAEHRIRTPDRDED